MSRPAPKRTRILGNLLLAELADKPSVPRREWCAVCGLPGPVTEHHIACKGQGGHDGPTVYLCGHGTAGCHGDAEDKRLHFRYRDGWEYRRTPTPCKYAYALEMTGWQPLPGEKEGEA